jgi:hypothetical protein
MSNEFHKKRHTKINSKSSLGRFGPLCKETKDEPFGMIHMLLNSRFFHTVFF